MALTKNVATAERIASIVLGGLAITQALDSKRSLPAKAAAGSAGVGLLWRGMTGHCPMYKSLDLSSKSNAPTKPQTLIERSALVNLPIEEVKSYLESNQTLYGVFISTGSDIYEIMLDGRLWMLNLQKHADGKRTLIKMSWDDHETQSRDVKKALSHLKDPPPRILELRKLKALLETGEIPTIEGQSHGERSYFGSAVQNFGNFIIEKIQSQSPLPEDPHLNQFKAIDSGYFKKEVNA